MSRYLYVRGASRTHLPRAVHKSEETFVNVLAGAQNAVTAWLTGAVAIEGDLLVAAKLDKYRR